LIFFPQMTLAIIPPRGRGGIFQYIDPWYKLSYIKYQFNFLEFKINSNIWRGCPIKYLK
jgi:hypothetical protein